MFAPVLRVGSPGSHTVRAPASVWEVSQVVSINLGLRGDSRLRKRFARLNNILIVCIDNVGGFTIPQL